MRWPLLLSLVLVSACVDFPRPPLSVRTTAWGYAYAQAVEKDRSVPVWAKEFAAATNLEEGEWFYLQPQDGRDDGDQNAETYLVFQSRAWVPSPARIHGKLGLRIGAELLGEAPHTSTYILEDYDRKLGLIYEDIKVGPYYTRRYYLPTLAPAIPRLQYPPEPKYEGMIVVAAARALPLRWRDYRELRRFVAKLAKNG